MSDQGIALKIEKLCKNYGKIKAVNGLSLEVEKGEIYGLLGPNGAGKSTTIKIIAGLLKPDSGSVRIYNGDITSVSTRERIGLCPQEIVVWESLTLMEQLIMIALMYNIDYKTAKKRASEMLEAMGLSEKHDKLASTLSGGMKRRLNILLALMHQPDIVILDEPQAGLDPQSRILVRDYIRSIAKRKTIIITTHDMEEADKLVDRVSIIDSGKILIQDTPQRLKETVFKGEIIEFFICNGTRKTELIGVLSKNYPIQNMNSEICSIVSNKPYETLREIEELITRYGSKLEDVRIRRATLEDVFISLTGRGLRE